MKKYRWDGIIIITGINKVAKWIENKNFNTHSLASPNTRCKFWNSRSSGSFAPTGSAGWWRVVTLALPTSDSNLANGQDLISLGRVYFLKRRKRRKISEIRPKEFETCAQTGNIRASKLIRSWPETSPGCWLRWSITWKPNHSWSPTLGIVKPRNWNNKNGRLCEYC